MKTLKEKIEVMQAALEGKEIEMKSWESIKFQPMQGDWNWNEWDYRIKEENKKPERKTVTLKINGLVMWQGDVFND